MLMPSAFSSGVGCPMENHGIHAYSHRVPDDMPASSFDRILAKLRERLENLKECFRISGLINSSLKLDEVLENIMTTSRSILKADACSLMLVDERSDELVFEVAQGPAADKIKGSMRIKRGQGIAGHVFDTGNAVLIEDAYSDPRFNKEFDRKTGYVTRTILCVPLKIKDRVIGVSQVINKLDGASFNAEDEETLSLLCANAAIAVENARLHQEILRRQQIEQDLAFASSIQLSFLPQEMPKFGGYSFDAFYQSAQEVGGDFYDFIALEENRIGILIGDVSGKGVASALFMARFTTDFHLTAILERDPEKVLSIMGNKVCSESCRGMFVTLLYMVLDRSTDELVYVNAGHLPPVLWNSSEDRYVSLSGSGGPPLGILSEQRYRSARVSLRAGDCILLSTDGLVEAKNEAGERFGWDRVEKAMRSGSSDVQSARGRISEALADFVKECPQADDTTLVILGVEER